jgi:hypothetical protein
MAVQFATLLNDYANSSISRRMMSEIKYRLPSYLCREKVQNVFITGKRNELFDTQTYWRLI